jgi:hypothetical protein
VVRISHSFGTHHKNLILFFEILSYHADLYSEAVQVIRDIVPMLGSNSTKKILTAVTPQLASAALDMRLSICDLLDSLAEADPSVQFLVILLSLFYI